MAPGRSSDVSQNELALAQARAREAEAWAREAKARDREAEAWAKEAELHALGEGRSVRCHVRLRGKERQLSNDAVMIFWCRFMD